MARLRSIGSDGNSGRSSRFSRAFRWVGPPGSSRRVVAVLSALALAVGVVAASGMGETSSARPVLDGGAWLGSANGTLVHANGVSARIDWTTSVPAGTYQVVQDQTGGFVDQGGGHFATIDGRAMKVGNPTEVSASDVVIATGGGSAYAVYRSDGVVQEVDPATLDARGDAVDLSGPIDSVGVDAVGNLYAALNSAHQIAVVAHDRIESLIGDGSDAGAQLVTVGTEVVAVDATARVVLMLHPDGSSRTVDLGVDPGTQLAMPALESGSTLWLTDVTHRALIGLAQGADVAQTVPLGSVPGALGPPQPSGAVVYLYDAPSGSLSGVDTGTGKARTQKLSVGSTDAEFFGKDGLVYVNDFAGPKAFVGNDLGVVTPLVKYSAAKPPPKPTAPAKKPAVKKLAPHLHKKAGRVRARPRPRPKPRARPKPRPKPRPKASTTTTTNPGSTTTTTTPGSTTTTTPGSTTTTTTPGSTTTTTTPGSTTTTVPDSTTTTTAPPSTTTTTTAPPGP